LFLLLQTSLFIAVAQEEKDPPVTLTKTETSGFTFEKIIDLPAVSKEQAYDRIKQWIITNLKTADNNIAFDDKEKNNISTATGLLLGKIPNAWLTNAVEFKISFSFKDNKMKINASQFVFEGQVQDEQNTTCEFDQIKGPLYPKGIRKTIYKKFDEKFAALIASAEAAAAKKDDKW